MITVHTLSETMQHLTPYKAVIFDLDDTLYNERDYVRSGYHAIAQAYPQHEHLEEDLWNAFLRKEPAIDSVLDSYGIADESIRQAWLHIYRFHQPDIVLPQEAKELLASLREQGKPLGIITDGRPEGQRAKIAALGIESLVDAIVITDELGGVSFRKPHPLAFQRMAEMLGMAYPDMVYIGDNTAKDFIAPAELGMGCVYFKNPQGLYIHV